MRLERTARLPLVLGLGALLSGCTASLVLHISRNDFDEQLKLFLGGGSNSTVLLHGSHEALLVDAKWGNFARLLRRDVEEDLAARVRRIVLTHAHDDHAGGLLLFDGAGAVLVHPNTRRRLEALGVHPPWIEVEREVRLVLDGEEVRVLSMGSGHTDGDLVVMLPGRRLLIAGDLITNHLEPYCDPRFGGSILELAQTLPKVMALPFDRVVPGHGTVMSRAEVQALTDYVVTMERDVGALLAAGKSEDEAVAQVTLPQFPLHGTLFVTSREGNVRAMYRALAAKR